MADKWSSTSYRWPGMDDCVDPASTEWFPYGTGCKAFVPYSEQIAWTQVQPKQECSSLREAVTNSDPASRARGPNLK